MYENDRCNRSCTGVGAQQGGCGIVVTTCMVMTTNEGKVVLTDLYPVIKYFFPDRRGLFQGEPNGLMRIKIM